MVPKLNERKQKPKKIVASRSQLFLRAATTNLINLNIYENVY